jgi:hypothetical protein
MDTTVKPRFPSQIIVSFRSHASTSCGFGVPRNQAVLDAMTQLFLPSNISNVVAPLILENCGIYIAVNLPQGWFSPSNDVVPVVFSILVSKIEPEPLSIHCCFARTCCHWYKDSCANPIDIAGRVSTSSHSFSFLRFQMHHMVMANICKLS